MACVYGKITNNITVRTNMVAILMTTYLDCNATTPVDPSVADIVHHYLVEEFGNAGSRTHDFGVKAKQAVEAARGHVADCAKAKKNEVVFTSGATESNNIAILGIRQHGEQSGKRHLITSQIEHKAVLEPFEHLESHGFEITYLAPDAQGQISPQALQAALRDDTLLVSLMHINNETGAIQDLQGFCEVLDEHSAYFHVDAAQGFGKYPGVLHNPRIDMISASGHKLYAPKGIGALITRRRDFEKIPLTPLMFGGGQERGLRPGTLPVALIAGFGEACRLAHRYAEQRNAKNAQIKERLLNALTQMGAIVNGGNTADHVLNVSIPGLNSETAMIALKGTVAVSNGSACTSSCYTPSHVLVAMGLGPERVDSALRISWCHMTDEVPLDNIVESLNLYL